MAIFKSEPPALQLADIKVQLTLLTAIVIVIDQFEGIYLQDLFADSLYNFGYMQGWHSCTGASTVRMFLRHVLFMET